MRQSDDLFKLVKSLSKSEKRYFKMMASMQKGEKKYLLLFDAIDRQECYDEAVLKEEFADEPFVRQFNVAKGYLYSLVLKSLRMFYADGGEWARLSEAKRSIRILLARGLVSQAEKFLIRALSIARAGERFQEILELQELESAIRPEVGRTPRGREEQYRRNLAVLERQRNLMEYERLGDRVHDCMDQGNVRTSDDLEQLELIIADPLLRDEKRALSLRARLYFVWIHMMYNYARNSFSESHHYSRRAVDMFDANEPYRAFRPDQYLSALNNYMHLCIVLQDDEGFQHGAEQLQRCMNTLPAKIRSGSPMLEADFFYKLYLNRIFYHINGGEYEKAAALRPEIDAGLQRHGRYLHSDAIHRFHINLTFVCIVLGDYDRALEYNTSILNSGEPVAGQRIYYAAHLLQLIIHYDLEHMDLLEHLVRSTYRYLLSRGGMHRFEEVFLRFLKELPRVADREELLQVFARLHEQLQALGEDPLEGNALRYFEYTAWLESKITGRPLLEVLHSRNAELSCRKRMNLAV